MAEGLKWIVTEAINLITSRRAPAHHALVQQTRDRKSLNKYVLR